MRVLITGAKGFSSSHLIPLLTSEPGLELMYSDVEANKTKDWHPCDLGDYRSTFKLIEDLRPHQIYHLAGTFSNDYDADYRGNILTTKNLLDSCLDLDLRCRILLIGSASEYGAISQSDNPVNENYPLSPVSIYGVTKSFQTSLMKYYCKVRGMEIVMARPFNLFGRGLSNRLFVGRLYQQIREYKNGTSARIIVGNLDARRDYIEVGEAVKDYKLIMEKGISGEIYNVGSGKSISLRELLERVLHENDLSIAVVEEKPRDDALKLDIKEIYADTTKIQSLRRTENSGYLCASY